MPFKIFVLCLAMVFFMHENLFAEKITVKSIEKQNNLKKAIHEAKPYDTVEVEGGVFVEFDIVIKCDPGAIEGCNY
jgi:hypothetical protein